MGGGRCARSGGAWLCCGRDGDCADRKGGFRRMRRRCGGRAVVPSRTRASWPRPGTGTCRSLAALGTTAHRTALRSTRGAMRPRITRLPRRRGPRRPPASARRGARRVPRRGRRAPPAARDEHHVHAGRRHARGDLAPDARRRPGDHRPRPVARAPVVAPCLLPPVSGLAGLLLQFRRHARSFSVAGGWSRVAARICATCRAVCAPRKRAHW